MYNADTNKVDAGEAIEGGIKSETFTNIKGKKGVGATIITEGEGDKETIIEIRVGGKKKKAAN